MPLFVEGKRYQTKFTSTSLLLDANPLLKRSTEETLCKEQRHFDSLERTVYVYQREIAASNPQDDIVDILGSDDATTCHILILRQTGSGVTVLSHFDGNSTEQGLQTMLQLVQQDKPSEGRIEAHLFGGFCDDRNSSAELTCELIAALQTQDADVHLQCLCCSEVNNSVRNGINWPVLYGVGVNVKTGEIFPATFEDKGPNPALRSARIFGGVHEMITVYDPDAKEFTIKPFGYSVPPHLSLLMRLPDDVFLKYTSTSPKVEKPGYVKAVRETFQFMMTNPQPDKTVFGDGRPHTYRLKDGKWVMEDKL